MANAYCQDSTCTIKYYSDIIQEITILNDSTFLYSKGVYIQSKHYDTNKILLQQGFKCYHPNDTFMTYEKLTKSDTFIISNGFINYMFNSQIFKFYNYEMLINRHQAYLYRKIESKGIDSLVLFYHKYIPREVVLEENSIYVTFSIIPCYQFISKNDFDRILEKTLTISSENEYTEYEKATIQKSILDGIIITGSDDLGEYHIRAMIETKSCTFKLKSMFNDFIY